MKHMLDRILTLANNQNSEYLCSSYFLYAKCLSVWGFQPLTLSSIGEGCFKLSHNASLRRSLLGQNLPDRMALKINNCIEVIASKQIGNNPNMQLPF
jgi:hypothetical protein